MDGNEKEHNKSQQHLNSSSQCETGTHPTNNDDRGYETWVIKNLSAHQILSQFKWQRSVQKMRSQTHNAPAKNAHTENSAAAKRISMNVPIWQESPNEPQTLCLLPDKMGVNHQLEYMCREIQ